MPGTGVLGDSVKPDFRANRAKIAICEISGPGAATSGDPADEYKISSGCRNRAGDG